MQDKHQQQRTASTYSQITNKQSFVLAESQNVTCSTEKKIN